MGGGLEPMFSKATLFLVILGAVDMGMSSWAGVSVVSTVFGDLSSVVSALIGLSGVYMLLDNYTNMLKTS
jgi:uncharacterized membrane protein YuzA (DUF378 family)